MRRMVGYIHTQEDWPRFRWNRESLSERLAIVRHEQGRLLGRMEALGYTLRQEAVLRTLTEDVLKSSEIEGEKLDAEHVRSSIARRLGVDIGGLKGVDRNVEGVVEMMLHTARLDDLTSGTGARHCARFRYRAPGGDSGWERWCLDSHHAAQVEVTCAAAAALLLINSAARCAWAAAVNTARLSVANTFSQVAI